MAVTKERAAFSIDRTVMDALEKAVPKSKRSQFVEKAIAAALGDERRRAALDMLDHLPSYDTGGEPVVETLRRLRQEREEQLASRHD
ncbi:MAG: hypothetical protein VYD64_00935 [Pseudomonadota bacterium]|nr:hypothetical protein [Pseudomonadota bacterium]